MQKNSTMHVTDKANMLDGYPGNWVSICETCTAAVGKLYCNTHSACLYNSCDERILADKSMALPNEREWIFTACENYEPAVFSSMDDAVFLYNSCDAYKYSPSSQAHHHAQVPVHPFSDLTYAPSSIYLPDSDRKGSPCSAPTIDEVYEDEKDFWLLLEPNYDENQMDSGSDFIQELDKPFGIKYQTQANGASDFIQDLDEASIKYHSCTEYQYEVQNNQQELYCNNWRDNESYYGIVPVQSVEVKERVEEHKQQEQQHNKFFNKKYEDSKAAFINAPTSSQTVPVSCISPKATTCGITNSSTVFSLGSIDPFRNFSFSVPLQFAPLNREAKVLRYREKKS